MLKHDSKIIEYTVLVFGIVVFMGSLYFYRYNKNAELIIMAMAAIFYAAWGVVHHLLEKRLTIEIALEYILISFFIFLLVFTALSV